MELCDVCGRPEIWNVCESCGCDLCSVCENEYPVGSNVYYCPSCFDELGAKKDE